LNKDQFVLIISVDITSEASMRARTHKVLGWLAAAVLAVLGVIGAFITDTQRGPILNALSQPIWAVPAALVVLAWLAIWLRTRPVPDTAGKIEIENIPIESSSAADGYGYSASGDARITVFGGTSTKNSRAGVHATDRAQIETHGLRVEGNGRK